MILSKESEIEIHDNIVTSKIYVPETIEKTTSPSYVEILKFSNAGLSLNRSKDSYVAKLAATNKLVKSKQFSLYVHDDISQLNIGGVQEYFIHPNTTPIVLPTINSKTWSVAMTDVKTKNGSQLSAVGSIVAHFDTTSKYIYVPTTPTSDVKTTTTTTIHPIFIV